MKAEEERLIREDYIVTQEITIPQDYNPIKYFRMFKRMLKSKDFKKLRLQNFNFKKEMIKIPGKFEPGGRYLVSLGGFSGRSANNNEINISDCINFINKEGYFYSGIEGIVVTAILSNHFELGLFYPDKMTISVIEESVYARMKIDCELDADFSVYRNDSFCRETTCSELGTISTRLLYFKKI